jgi:GcrA cell cycle regulator
MNGKFFWDETARSKLRELWDEGLSLNEIGRRIGVSKNAVMGKSHRMDLPARPSPIKRDDTISVEEKARRKALRTAAKVTLPPLLNAPRDPMTAFPSAPPAPPPAPKPVIAAPPPPPPAKILPFRRVVDDCCWPIGTPGKADFRYCDAPTKEKSPYCAQHHKLSYVKTTVSAEQVAGNMAITSGRVAVAR